MKLFEYMNIFVYMKNVDMTIKQQQKNNKKIQIYEN